jgi:hypothetical protein
MAGGAAVAIPAGRQIRRCSGNLETGCRESTNDLAEVRIKIASVACQVECAIRNMSSAAAASDSAMLTNVAVKYGSRVASSNAASVSIHSGWV